MKNEEVSLMTKTVLAESLKKAMAKKPFQKITVSELIRDCDMNRNTFYYHFEDIHALLRWLLKHEAIEVMKNFDYLVDYKEALTFLLDYIDKNAYMINGIRDIYISGEFKRYFFSDFMCIILPVIKQAETIAGKNIDDDYREFLGHFYMDAISGALTNHIQNKTKRSHDEEVKYISNSLWYSLLGVLSEGNGTTK